MLTNTISNKWSEPIDKSLPTIELISFDIGEVSFGIPITKIDRIISNIHLERLAVCLDAYNSEKTSESLAKPSRSRSVSKRRDLRRCDSNRDHTLTENFTILDLHDRLTHTAIVNPTAIAIFTNDRQQLIGIPINTVPTLLAVPLDLIRTIPHEFRIASPLGIASHLAIVPMPTTKITIFILAN